MGYYEPKNLPKNQTKKIPVAVKVIDRKFVDSIQDFEKNMDRELQVISTLKHRNIVNFYEMKPTKNNYYYVFDYVEGKELKEIIAMNKRIDELEA